MQVEDSSCCLYFDGVTKMKRTLCFIAIVLAVLIHALLLQGQDVPPTIKSAIIPKNNPAQKTPLTDLSAIELAVDEKGIPTEVVFSGGLPDSVVQAISEARFNPALHDGKPISASVRLNVPIPKDINYFTVIWARPSVGDSVPLETSIAEGSKLNLAAARTLELKLDSSVDSVSARTSLISFAAAGEEDELRQIQGRQIEWLVRHNPESAVLGSPASMLFTADVLFQNSSSYSKVRGAWFEKLNQRPNDPFIIGHASYFFRLSDPEIAEQLSQSSLTNFGGVTVWLGELYGLAALGVTSIDYQTGGARTAGTRLPDSGFGKHAQAELASTIDSRVLISSFATVSQAGRSLSKFHSLPEGFAGFCQSLLTRVKTINSTFEGTCEINVPAAREALLGKVEVGKLSKSPKPPYPNELKKKHIEGQLQFRATVGEDGKIKSLLLLKGPLAFYTSSRDVISKWEYEPTLLDREPVEVITTITVSFSL